MISTDQNANPSRAEISADDPHRGERVERAIREERLRISRDLHDDTAQYATILKLRLQRVRSSSVEAEVVGEIDRAIGDVDILIDNLRNIADDLRADSSDNRKFIDKLKIYISQWSADYGISSDIMIDPPNFEVRSSLDRILLHVAREALVNIINHARDVSHVTIVLQCNSTDVTLTIDDDGAGFNPAKLPSGGGSPCGRGLGLVGMRERLALVGGSLEITSGHGSGTKVRARVSIEAPST